MAHEIGPSVKMKKTNRTCDYPDCDKKHHALGYCKAHHTRLKRAGNPAGEGLTPKGVPLAFLMDLVGTDLDDCIEWPFARSGSGYARVEVGSRPNRKTTPASRVICEIVHGLAPDMDAAHSCGNGSKGCVNPNHIRWLTHAQNQAEMILHGNSTRGEKSSHAKISESDVRLIRNSSAQTYASLAQEFGISLTQAWRIKNGERWQHVS